MKPMLASPAPAQLTFPLYASPKLDGVRAVIKGSMVLSRSLKPIPNQFVQDEFGRAVLDGLDGELTVGPSNAPNVMQATTSGVMSQEGEPDVTLWVFDFWTDTSMQYADRWRLMRRGFKDHALDGHPRVKLLQQVVVNTAEELLAYEQVTLEAGFEGVMLRKPTGLYKYGRSTAREGHLLKLKRFVDGEAVVTGAQELMRNGNEATVNELGHTFRSHAQDGLAAGGTLGALLVQDMVSGISFGIGTGYTAAQRAELWAMWQAGKLAGRIVKYKHFEAAGVKEAPRFPVFCGFRNPIDMG